LEKEGYPHFFYKRLLEVGEKRRGLLADTNDSINRKRQKKEILGKNCASLAKIEEGKPKGTL